MKYSCVEIIFNPNSTGPSHENAKKLRRKLKKFLPDTAINLHSTQFAGHAEELAYQLAKANQHPLIISSSGDGGYHEVVNGAMKAQKEGAKPICAVLPSGNANDHARTLHEKELVDLVLRAKPLKIDLLKCSFKTKGSKKIRYAHSYSGLGLTPVVAVELNKTDLNSMKELWIILKTFYKFRPFKIQRKGKTFTLDSILFANIGEMAKVLTISKDSKIADGKFEVITFPHNRKMLLIGKLSRAAVSSLNTFKSYKIYEFEVLKRMPAQLDGEVYFIDKKTAFRVESECRILQTLI